jgi:YidC/Oxa1 family membrane protein insertase
VERRFLYSILFIVAIVIGVKFLTDAKPSPTPPANPSAPGSSPLSPEAAAAASPPPANPPVAPGAPGNPPPPPAGPPATPAAPQPAPAPPAPQESAKLEEFELRPKSGEFYRVGFTTRGAAITVVTLDKIFETSERDVPAGGTRQRLDVIVPVDPDRLPGMTQLEDLDTERLKILPWTVESRSDTEVKFSFTTTTGLVIRKVFTIPTASDRFDLDVTYSVERTGADPKAAPRQAIWFIGVSGVIRESGTTTSGGGPAGIQPVLQILDTHDEPAHEDWHFPRIELNAIQQQTRAFRLAGVATPYFLAALWSEGGPKSPEVLATEIDGGDKEARNRNSAYLTTKETIRRLVEWYRAGGRDATGDRPLSQRLTHAAENFHRVWVEFETPVVAKGAAPTPSTFHLYVGPLSRRVLGQDRYESLAPLITYPAAPDFVAKFLLFIFDLWRGVTSSAGLAIILMTITVRGGLMPLSIRNQLSMRRHGKKLAKIKPKLEAIKERYAANPKKYREEQQKLMKEHGIGFPMGCLMMLLQIPIFFSLFSSLRVEFDIRHASFLWITDLSGPDRIIDFGRNVLDFLPITEGWGGLRGINILPIVYIVLSIYQQKLMPPPQDAQQAQQMKMTRWMSIIFSVLLYNYTAALALYMCMSSLVALIESRIVRAKDRAETLAASA